VAVVVHGSQPSASTQKMPAATATVQALKYNQPDVPVILVGGHPAALPVKSLAESGADYVCTGEGPVFVYEIYKSAHVSSVQVTRTPNIMDLANEMPGGCWDMLPMGLYRSYAHHAWSNNFKRTPYASIYTSLGCPFSCSFCMIQSPFREGDKLTLKGKANSYRTWPASSVIAEIEELVERYNVTNIRINDEMFVLQPKHLESVCNAIAERYNDKLNLWCYGRADRVDQKSLDYLNKAGFKWLCLGIESASEYVRDGVSKSEYGPQQIFETCARIKRSGVNLIANYMFGLPDDTAETMKQTLDMALEVRSEYVNFYCFPDDTAIYTPVGTQPIETIKPGDDVCIRKSTGAVERTISREYDGEMIEVKPRYLPAVRMTPEHPVLIAKLARDCTHKGRYRAKLIDMSWKSAKDITCWDKARKETAYDAVVVSKTMLHEDSTHADFSAFVKGQIGGRGIGKGPGGQLSAIGKKYLDKWPLDENLAEFLGWYVAEGSRGSAYHNCVTLALGENEPDNINRVKWLIKNCFGFHSWSRPNRRGAVQIIFVSKVLRRALPVICGSGARNKRVPDFIMGAKKSIVEAFLKGYVNGDGTSHPNKNGQYSCSSASKNLTLQIMMLLLKVGVVPGYAIVSGGERKLKNNVIKTGWSYKLSWTKQRIKYRWYVEDDEHFYIPVKSVSTFRYKGLVHNFATTDETYSVPFVVHNCAVAFPGSKLWDDKIKQGWKPPDNWLAWSFHSYEHEPLGTKYLSPKEVLWYRDVAFRMYYSNPSYRAYVLGKFGERAIKEIDFMLSHELKRKLLEDKAA